MRVIQTIARLDAKDGGPSRSVAALCTALARHKVQVELLTLRPPFGSSEMLPASDLVPTHLVEAQTHFGRPYPRIRSFKKTLHNRATDSSACIIHDHGLWLPTNHAAAQVAMAVGVPRMVSPRGMLSDGALQYRRWKKRAAWLGYQRRDLLRANVIHATSAAEADAIRALGLALPVAVLPNGVEMPSRPVTERAARQIHRALFLSRIHPQKGLIDLIRAWSSVRPENWELVLAGPDEVDHRDEIERLIRTEGLSGQVHFAGPIPEAEKWDEYARADLFTLPSLGESFGMVVAEALASGLPVITTRATPWQSMETEECGWWVENGVGPLVRALEQATSTSAETRAAMGERGRKLVAERHSWDRVGADMKSVYLWMVGRAPRPTSVD